MTVLGKLLWKTDSLFTNYIFNSVVRLLYKSLSIKYFITNNFLNPDTF